MSLHPFSPKQDPYPNCNLFSTSLSLPLWAGPRGPGRGGGAGGGPSLPVPPPPPGGFTWRQVVFAALGFTLALPLLNIIKERIAGKVRVAVMLVRRALTYEPAQCTQGSHSQKGKSDSQRIAYRLRVLPWLLDC